LKANTVERHLTFISQAHQLAGIPNPVEDKLVRTVMAGIRRVKGSAQTGKDPLSPELLRKMFTGAGDDLRWLRDRALLLIGFAGAFRRSELVALRYEDVRFTDKGIVATIPKSKNRSGRRRPHHRHSLRFAPGKLPGPRPSRSGSRSRYS
jgi:integrase